MSAGAICEYLEWDSQFFGRRIARVKGRRMTPESGGEVEAWCAAENIDCLYFLADFSDPQTVRLAEEKMYQLVDARVTLELRLRDAEAAAARDIAAVRDATAADIAKLQAIARRAHRDSRFYYDGSFPAELCDRLYETWIQRSCEGWAKKVLVAVEGADVQGYVTCHLEDEKHGEIGLVGVDEEAQGKGAGKKLVAGAVAWFAEQNVDEIRVVTQGRNVRAQRLYQRAGFVTRSVELWFHKWFSRAQASA